MAKEMSFEHEEREAKVAALRAALDEGEAGGNAMPFDFEAYIEEKRRLRQEW
jgi:Arc/MetJ-type ribon-helix-helix transcriptional regulator